jgi:pyridoxine kinase
VIGYIGNYAILEKIEKMVQKLKAKNPNLIYGKKKVLSILYVKLVCILTFYLVCDTVMGDGGQLYVAPEIVPLYRKIMQFADVVTPNQFEAE